MIKRLTMAARHRAQAWAEKRQGLDPDPVVLERRRIYILPTRQGFVFGVLLFAMLLGSMNYSSNLGFILTFFLAALGFVAMHHTHRNLQGLELEAGHAEPVFAGEEAVFPLIVRNHASVARGGIALDRDKEVQQLVDLEAQQTVFLKLRVPAEQRGWLQPKRFGIHSSYPFGLFRAWVWLRMDMRCLVYPAPADKAVLPPPLGIDSGSDELHAQGQEDFSGLRNYVAGDAPRHVAWRASARNDGDLLVKEFRGGGVATRWLDWETTSGFGDVEQRLSCMTRWLIDAHQHGENWGLRLPGQELPLDGGEKHYRRSLQALALHALPDGGS